MLNVNEGLGVPPAAGRVQLCWYGSFHLFFGAGSRGKRQIQYRGVVSLLGGCCVTFRSHVILQDHIALDTMSLSEPTYLQMSQYSSSERPTVAKGRDLQRIPEGSAPASVRMGCGDQGR